MRVPLRLQKLFLSCGTTLDSLLDLCVSVSSIIGSIHTTVDDTRHNRLRQVPPFSVPLSSLFRCRAVCVVNKVQPGAFQSEPDVDV